VIVLANSQEKLLKTLHPDISFRDVQKYIGEVLRLRGMDNQPVQAALLLLMEEAGELAKAVRKSTPGMSMDKERVDSYSTAPAELADIFIILAGIANILGIDLLDALVAKEKINCARDWDFVDGDNV
jgi:NTP pyrophosphatase (non-canonical NTP hydrolase)